MAKTLVTYRLYPFDNVRAAAGALCVMVPSSYNGKITIDNVQVDGIKNININSDGTYSSDNTDFLGAGICRYKAPNNYFFSVNSITYTFNERGDAISLNAKRKMLKLAEQVNLTLTASGSVVGNAYPTTRGSVSDQSEAAASTNYNSVGTVLVDTLNARDEFAAQALRGMLAHINDPSTLSDNEIAFYCEEAYRWAASMMLSAANRRANGYENTTDTALGQIATAVSQGSQSTIGMNTVQNSGLTVSPASVTGTGTFTLGVANGYVIPASGDAQNWQRAWTFANSSGINNGTITLGNNSITPLTASNMWTALNSPDSTKKIDVSHLPDSILKWSDLTNSGNSEKIHNAHINLTSGNDVANKIPVISSNGVMEAGTYMDFHDLRENNTNATDYNTRLQIGNPSLNNGKGNTVTLPNNSGTLALVENTVSTSTTWWGREISNGKVEGNINNANNIFMSGNLHVVGPSENAFSIGYSDYVTSSQTPSYKTLLGVHSLAHPDPALYIGYGLRYNKRLELHGRKIQFTIQKSTATDFDEDASTAMTILGRESAGKEGYVGIGISDPTSMLHVAGAVRIGNILLTSEGSKLKISRYDGTAADVYSTGGVTALGIPSSNSGTVDNVSTKQLNIVGDSNTAKLFVEGSELRVTINNTTYRVNLTQIS